jgi:hypothetical protein
MNFSYLSRSIRGAFLLLVLVLAFSSGANGARLAVIYLDEATDLPSPDLLKGSLLPGGQVLILMEDGGPDLPGALILGEASEPPQRIWISREPLDDEVRVQEGIRVILDTGRATVFTCETDTAHRLIGRGVFLASLDLRPLSRALGPHFGWGFHRVLAESRPLAERLDLVDDLVDAVNPESIRETVRFLNYDHTRGDYRTRFPPRSEVAADIVPYLVDMLESHISPTGGEVRLQPFDVELEGSYEGGDTTFYNVIAEVPGRRTSASYIICGHYDAIASRTAGWSDSTWKTDPAPGADDNATGVAAVMECARILSTVELDVGLKFVAFSGEELGLLGSKVYAPGVASDSIIGVFNFDMIGYVNPVDSVPRVDLAYDWRSGWLAQELVAVAETLGIETEVETVDMSGYGPYSDHNQFWLVGIPATMLIEDLVEDGGVKGRPINPYYHTLGDTLGHINEDLVADNVRMVVGLLARFAELPEDTLPDILLTEVSIEWRWDGRGVRPMVAGKELTARIRALNRGAAMEEPLPYTLRIKRTGSTGGTAYEDTELLFLAKGATTDLEISWDTPLQDYGEVTYEFSLLPVESGVESDLEDNVTTASLEVMSPGFVIADVHVYPNPASRASEAWLAFDIYNPEGDFRGEMTVEIYDLLGVRLGGVTLVRSYVGTPDLEIGRNTVALSSILEGRDALSPGVYVCLLELRLIGEGGVVTGKTTFAVAR